MGSLGLPLISRFATASPEGEALGFTSRGENLKKIKLVLREPSPWGEGGGLPTDEGDFDPSPPLRGASPEGEALDYSSLKTGSPVAASI